MDKANLINEIASKREVKRELVSQIVEEFMVTVKKAVAEGDEVTLRGFGTFKNVLRHEKNFHYAPGKYKVVPEHYEVMLKYCKEVRGAVK